MKAEIKKKCWLCKQHEETVDHLTLECPVLAKNVYVMRQNRVCGHLHYSIREALGIETREKCTNKHTHPKPVCEQEGVTVLRNQVVHSGYEK